MPQRRGDALPMIAKWRIDFRSMTLLLTGFAIPLPRNRDVQRKRAVVHQTDRMMKGCTNCAMQQERARSSRSEFVE